MIDPDVNPIDFEKWMKDEAAAGRGSLVCIEAQPYSKANSRRMATFRRKDGRTGLRSIKSEKALNFDAIAKAAALCYMKTPPFEGDVAVYALLAYGSRRSDVDESLLLDSLQGKCYKNDRQVRIKLIFGIVDSDRPRATVLIKQIRSGVAGVSKKKPLARGPFANSERPVRPVAKDTGEGSALDRILLS